MRLINFSIDLVLLTYNHSDLTLECLESLKFCTKGLYRLIWIDNGSDLKHYEPVKKVINVRFKNCKMFRYSKNYGFARGMNKGIKLSKSKIVVLLNNDITFNLRWLDPLIQPFMYVSKVGVSGAITDNTSSIQRQDRIRKRLHRSDNEWFYNHKSGNISYFCTAISKELIKKIGYLDEEFFNGGEDDDFNDRAKAAGFKVGVALKSFVSHKHCGSRDDPDYDRKKYDRQNRLYLRKKRKARRGE